MKQPDLSLCMIVAPKNGEAKRLKRALESVGRYVDEICITVTGENKNVERVAEKYGAKVSQFTWVDDFAKARTFNFSQATGRWILWLDADDVLEKPEQLHNLVKFGDQNKIDGFYLKYLYNFDTNGNCIDEHWKMQILKNDGHFEWRGAIHEDAIQLRPVRWIKEKEIVRVHNTSDERGAESSKRNLRILKKELKRNPSEPRTYFYLGRGYIALGEFSKAIKMLEKYLTLSGWDEERYEATLLIGQSYFQMGDYATALLHYNSAILEREDYPDAYISKGMCYMKMGEYEKATTNLGLALRQTLPSGSVFFNPMLYRRDVFGALATCYLQTGKIAEALQSIKQALAVDKNNKALLDLQDIILGVYEKRESAKAYLDVAKALKRRKLDKGIQALLHSVPADLQDNPIINAIRAEHYKPVTWPERSIAIFCGSSAENWTPESLNAGGIGGSETAVIELSKRLVKMGWQVTVFNDCNVEPEGKDFDGVLYKNYWSFNHKDKFDVLWSWRLPEVFDLEIDARLKILDLHDVMSVHDFPAGRLQNIDKIFVKTNYHRSLFPQVPDEKFVVIGNGINLERFNQAVKKEPYRFIYSSTPNRGLDIILKSIWPKIKEKLPEAELHVYYGWNTYYKLEKNNPERMAWMQKVQEMMNQAGVVDHGRVGQAELAIEQLKSSFWLYPTYFPEIHCITACEMQASGAIPLTSGYAALEETQQSGLKLKGDVYDPKWQAEFIEKITTLTDEWIQSERAKGIEVAKTFTWDEVATKWHAELN